jgi:hypothetical protein
MSLVVAALVTSSTAVVLMPFLLLAGSLLHLARQALPGSSSPTAPADGRETDDPVTERRAEELIRERLYGQRLNVSRT